MDEKELYELVCVKNRCPKCQGETHQTEKETFSGQEMREYQCRTCGWRHIFELGPALWTVFSGANRDELLNPAASPDSVPLPPRAKVVPGRTRSERFNLLVLLGCGLLVAAVLLLIRFS